MAHFNKLQRPVPNQANVNERRVGGMKLGAYERLVLTKLVDLTRGSRQGEVEGGEGIMNGGDREDEADER